MILSLLLGSKFTKRRDRAHEYWLGWFGGSLVERSKLGVLWHKERISHLRLRANHSTTDLYLVFAFIFSVRPYSYVYAESAFPSKYVSHERELKAC